MALVLPLPLHPETSHYTQPVPHAGVNDVQPLFTHPPAQPGRCFRHLVRPTVGPSLLQIKWEYNDTTDPTSTGALPPCCSSRKSDNRITLLPDLPFKQQNHAWTRRLTEPLHPVRLCTETLSPLFSIFSRPRGVSSYPLDSPLSPPSESNHYPHAGPVATTPTPFITPSTSRSPTFTSGSTSPTTLTTPTTSS